MSIQTLADDTGITIGDLEKTCILRSLEPLLSVLIAQEAYDPNDMKSAGTKLSMALDTLAQQDINIDLANINWDGPILTNFTIGNRDELPLLLAIGYTRADLLGRIINLRLGLSAISDEHRSENSIIWQTLLGRGVITMATPFASAPAGMRTLHSTFSHWLYSSLSGSSSAGYDEAMFVLASVRSAYAQWPNFLTNRIHFIASNRASTEWLMVDSIAGRILSYKDTINPINGITQDYSFKDWATESTAIKQMFIDNNIDVDWPLYGLN